jgi:transcriptional regulator
MPETRQTDHWLRGTLELLLLQALAESALHGYAIARHIERVTDDALSVEEGSLYPALHRLEERGLVLAKWTKGEKGRRVRSYSLTAAGRKRLGAQKRDWSAFSRAVARMVDEP